MKHLLFSPLVLAAFLSLSACLSDESQLQVCSAYLAMNGAKLRFDGNALVGKELQVFVDGRLAYDSCQGGSQDLGETRYYFPFVETDKSYISMTLSKELTLPSEETIEVRAHTLCSDPIDVIGSANIIYRFQYHPENRDCDHDYYLAEQDMVLR